MLGLVGKGSRCRTCIDLDTMLDLTAKAQLNGTRFDGVDLFLFDPHVSIDISDDGLKGLADKIRSKGFVVGSVVAPVWPPTGGGSAMGSAEDRKNFVGQVRKACRIAKGLRDLGIRPYGVVRIDSACSPSDWLKDAAGNTQRIAETFREACTVAEGFGERLAAEGEICWGAMHSWREMVKLWKVAGPRPYCQAVAHRSLHARLQAPQDAISQRASIERRQRSNNKTLTAAASWTSISRRAERRDGQGRFTRRAGANACQRSERQTNIPRDAALARTKGMRQKPSGIFAGMAACFAMMTQQTCRHSVGDDRRPQREWMEE